MFFLMIRRPPNSPRTDTLCPHTTLCRTKEFKVEILLHDRSTLSAEGKGFGPDLRRHIGKFQAVRSGLDIELPHILHQRQIVAIDGHRHVALRRSRVYLREESRGRGADEQGKKAGSTHQNFLLRSEEHTSELQSLMRIPYAVFCLKQKT